MRRRRDVKSVGNVLRPGANRKVLSIYTSMIGYRRVCRHSLRYRFLSQLSSAIRTLDQVTMLEPKLADLLTFEAGTTFTRAGAEVA